jgi:transcriptional regulator GlxA family with amidase domain
MKHLTILVPEGQNNLSSIVGPYKIFTKANEHFKERGPLGDFRNQEVFRIELAGISNEVHYHGGLFTIKPHTQISRIVRTDLIIIPSLNHNYHAAIEGNKPLIDWITKRYKEGSEIASICTGAFLLASTGLLNGRSCSTNWAVADSFRSRFPKVHLQVDKLITDENGIYTNGGAYSFLNLIIYLVEKYYDRQTAIFCAKVFQIEMDRASQSRFIIFQGQKQHDDEMVKKAQGYMESNIQDKISIEELSSRFPVSRRQFDRRFIKVTGNTPVEYMQRLKVESAKKSLEVTRKTITEVMYEVGYSDEKAFREVFRKITGITPLEYRTRYNREAFQIN